MPYSSVELKKKPQFSTFLVSEMTATCCKIQYFDQLDLSEFKKEKKYKRKH